jgi:hypothetical protein
VLGGAQLRLGVATFVLGFRDFGFCFRFRAPIFISACGLGGVLNIRRAI